MWEKYKPIAQKNTCIPTHASCETPTTPHSSNGKRVHPTHEGAAGRRVSARPLRAAGPTQGPRSVARHAALAHRQNENRSRRSMHVRSGRARLVAGGSGDARRHEEKRPQNCGTGGIPPSKTERHLHARTDAASGVTRRTSTRAVSAGRLREAHRRPARRDGRVGPGAKHPSVGPCCQRVRTSTVRGDQPDEMGSGATNSDRGATW